MAALKAVTKCMERIAPLRLAEKWDNVGLLLESPVLRSKANRVLLTIDLTPAVLSESVATPTTLIISYHPPIFKTLTSLTLSDSTPLQAALLICAAQGISIYCPHTACDSVWGGVNDWLAKGVQGGTEPDGERGEVLILGGEKVDANGLVEGGEGRLVRLARPIMMGELEARIKHHLNLAQIQVGYASTPSKPIQSVAICAGSGGSMLLGRDADVYLTGEMSHHEVLAAVGAEKHVILCGHTNTERGYLPILADRLRTELSLFQSSTATEYDQASSFASFSGNDQQIVRQLEVHVSKTDRHPLVFV
jgi:dinuclear metal center YbgI/SA1388 family protein